MGPTTWGVAAADPLHRAPSGAPVGPAPPGVAPTLQPLSSPNSIVAADLTIHNQTVAIAPSSFWGADLRVYYPLGSGQAALFNATPLQYVRWPGGAVADGYDASNNLIYSDDGSSFSPTSSLSEFVTWCRWVSCHAIVQLPGEINRPQVAASEVNFIEGTLGFHPSYWEIGNEPAQWTHFGYSWSQWNNTQNQNASPGSYAQVVQGYAKAIRAVDSKARLIGLPGVGTGGYHEDIWIRATVALNGPNLSAVAIHVYPAGGTSGSNGTLSSFLNTLSGHGSLAYRAPIDRQAIATSCPTCRPIQLFVSEFGTGTQGGTYDRWMSSFAGTAYLAAEVAQAMVTGVANLDLFAFQSSYNGSLLDASGSTTRSYTLYSALFSALQPGILTASIASASPGVYVVAAASASWSTYSLMVVNDNASHPLRLNLLGSGFPLLGSGTVWAWNSTSTAPISSSFSTLAPSVWTIPARSIFVLQISV